MSLAALGRNWLVRQVAGLSGYAAAIAIESQTVRLGGANAKEGTR